MIDVYVLRKYKEANEIYSGDCSKERQNSINSVFFLLVISEFPKNIHQGRIAQGLFRKMLIEKKVGIRSND